MNDPVKKANIEVLKELLDRADKLDKQMKSLKAEIDGFLKQHVNDENFVELFNFFGQYVLKKASREEIASAFKERWKL